MKVILISHTPEPEKLIASSAKLCYSDSDISDIRDSLTPEKIRDFINMLISVGHESVLEHVSFTFGIEGISRACSHQLVRHRIASYSQKSQRYVDERDSFEYITPPEILGTPDAREKYDKIIANIADGYSEIADILTEKHRERLLSEGADEKTANSKARKLAIEDARFLLPNACETKIIVTMNVRSLFNFFRLRCCNRAQWEIHAVADEMLKLCMETAPDIFRYAGPSCVSDGTCPEGNRTCGKICEVRKKYRS